MGTPPRVDPNQAGIKTIGHVPDTMTVITSVRQAAAVCNVSPPVIRRWLSLGLIPGPQWTRAQLLQVRGVTDPEGRRRGNRGAHGTITRWNAGCSCTRCRQFQSETARARGRARAQQRLPVQMRQQLLDAIYAGRPFRTVLRDLGMTSNQVWGLAKTDQEWAEKLDTALTQLVGATLSMAPTRLMCTDVYVTSAANTSG
jgi:hypothetical protein